MIQYIQFLKVIPFFLKFIFFYISKIKIILSKNKTYEYEYYMGDEEEIKTIPLKKFEIIYNDKNPNRVVHIRKQLNYFAIKRSYFSRFDKNVIKQIEEENKNKYGQINGDFWIENLDEKYLLQKFWNIEKNELGIEEIVYDSELIDFVEKIAEDQEKNGKNYLKEFIKGIQNDPVTIEFPQKSITIPKFVALKSRLLSIYIKNMDDEYDTEIFFPNNFSTEEIDELLEYLMDPISESNLKILDFLQFTF